MAPLPDVFASIAATARSSPLVAALVATTAIFVAILAFMAVKPPFSRKAPDMTPDSLPLVGSWGFFNRRWDFWQKSMAASKTGNFSFYLGKHQVVGLSGEQARKMYLDNRHLDFDSGYTALLGLGPATGVQEVPEADTEKGATYFTRRLVALLKSDKLQRRMPVILKDAHAAVDTLAQDPTGVTNPFNSMYALIFKLTIRMVGADEIAEDPKLLSKCLYYYEAIDATSTAASVVTPWLPSFAYAKRAWAGYNLYMMFQRIVDKRKKEGRRLDDPLQFLIDNGDNMINIISFVIGALFAGLINSGINAGSVLTFLANEPTWQDKVLAETKAVAAKYATNKEAPLLEQLDSVPLEAWESQFPVVDLCLKESIRINVLGTFFRHNITQNAIPIPGSDEVIPSGAFACYHISDIHHNPEIYPDPMKFDPNRYIEGREEHKKQLYAFSGWGNGRHPCLGMRFAKLEQNIIVAYAVAKFKWNGCDEAGNPCRAVQEVDLNCHTACKPKKPVHLKYVLREKL